MSERKLTPEQRAADRALCDDYRLGIGDGWTFRRRSIVGWPAALDDLDVADAEIVRLRRWLRISGLCARHGYGATKACRDIRDALAGKEPPT